MLIDGQEVSPEEREARVRIAQRTLDEAVVASCLARTEQAQARLVYRDTTDADPNLVPIRTRWFASCAEVQRAEDAEQAASDALNKILEDKGTPVTYTEAQIRAVYDDSGFANTADGLIEALRSLS